MKIPPEKLYSPLTERALPLKICRMDEAEREDWLLELITRHLVLAIKCQNALFMPLEDSSRLLVQQEARRQAQTFRSNEQAERAFLALFELKEIDWIKKALAGIGQPKPIHRQIIRRFMNVPNLESVQRFLSILFENHQDSLTYRQYTPTMPSHTLWIWALEDIPDDWGLSQREKSEFKAFYRFFVQQPDYSKTLNLLSEKFPELDEEFDQILQTENHGIWWRRVYEEKIKRHPNEFATHLAKMRETDVPLDEISYNTLINKCQTYQQGIDLFTQMKQAGLTPNEISYNTLINKCQTYQQGIELFAEMKQAGLKINVITFNTLLKKAVQNKQPLHIILDLLDEMISLKIKPSVRKGVDKKGKPIKPHTVYAVQDKLRRSQKPYRTWVHQKYQQLQNQPQWLQDEWDHFFRQTLR